MEKTEFCNGYIRPLADHLAGTYQWCKDVLAVFDNEKLGGDYLAADEMIQDSSDLDGRNQITTGDVSNIILMARIFVSQVDANESVLKTAVNPR